MLVNLAKKFWNFVHALALFSWLISKTLTSYFKIMGPFFKKKFVSNHYLWLVLCLVWCGAESKNLGWPLLLIFLCRILNSDMYRLDRQCCGLRHCPHGQCLFFLIFPQLLAWAKLRFRINSGQCHITAAILPEALSTWTMPLFLYLGLSWMNAAILPQALSNIAYNAVGDFPTC